MGARSMLWVAAGLLTTLVVGAPVVYAGSVQLPGLGGDIEMEVTSFQERRFSTILRQENDFSCGSAAVASLLSYHYDTSVSERTVFDAMLASADRDKVRREGFSMLDMKRYLEAQGYQADGFRMPLEQIAAQVRLPLIVLLDLNGFRHFVVVKGISDQEVLVGDPTRGLLVLSRDVFESRWDGVAFVIRDHVAQGRETFNRDAEWHRVARAPVNANNTPGDRLNSEQLLMTPMGLEW
ncbi:C39 family peptidase [Marinobacter sp. BGYM27]|uniref:C39 family peptidase n=1 Tax=unclassified Marinobacter TaxID=83889 RepID=UPI0021A45EFB|nr:C39 family peptidase [Marinobacter sp. BGYM27]MDG5500928.1 C39 family peptidase [Marinobacter sp. BGYM27]